MKPVFPNPHISFSSMADFGYCRRYWYLIRKRKRKSRETANILGGRYGHDALHQINRFIKADKEAFDAIEVKRIFDKSMRPLNVSLPFYEDLWQGIRNHAEETHASQPTIFEAEYPLKVELKTKNDGKIWIVGTLDRLDIEGSVATLWDYKVTYRIPSKEELRANEQFMIYCYLIWSLFPQVKEIRIKWHAVLAGKSRMIKMDLTKLTSIEEHLAKQWHDIRTEKVWPTNAPNMRCDTCPKVCDDYKTYLRQVYHQKDIRTLDDKAVVYLATSGQMTALKNEHDRLGDDIKREVELNMGAPVIAGGRKWELATKHRKGSVTEPTDYTVLVPVKMIGVYKNARQRASEKGMVGNGRKRRGNGGKSKGLDKGADRSREHDKQGVRRSDLTGGEIPSLK